MNNTIPQFFLYPSIFKHVGNNKLSEHLHLMLHSKKLLRIGYYYYCILPTKFLVWHLPQFYDFCKFAMVLPNIYWISMLSTHLWYVQLCCQICTTLLPNPYGIYTSMVSTDLLPYIYGSLWDLQLSMITMASTGISRVCWCSSLSIRIT